SGRKARSIPPCACCASGRQAAIADRSIAWECAVRRAPWPGPPAGRALRGRAAPMLPRGALDRLRPPAIPSLARLSPRRDWRPSGSPGAERGDDVSALAGSRPGQEAIVVRSATRSRRPVEPWRALAAACALFGLLAAGAGAIPLPQTVEASAVAPG